MILALASTNAPLEKVVLEYLLERSFRAVPVKELSKTMLKTLANERRHLALTGVRSIDDIVDILELADFRLVFVGEILPDQRAERELLALAAVQLCDQSTEAFEGLRQVAVAGMSAFIRPSWDHYFMQIAKVVAGRANCMKRQVAAVVVREERIVATGYNGTPRGAKNCNEGGCERCNTLAPSGTSLDACVCCHAEENAIAHAAYHGTRIQGATLYCTHSPCLHCAKLIVNAGISRVVFNEAYPMNQQTLLLFDECGIRCESLLGGEGG